MKYYTTAPLICPDILIFKLLYFLFVNFSMSIHRWKVANCTKQLFSACVNRTNNEHWTISKTSGAYNSKPSCPAAFQFGLPINGFQQQKVGRICVCHEFMFFREKKGGGNNII